MAVLGSEIEVGDCKSKPLVLQLKQGTSFTLKNSGASKVAITFDKDHVDYVDPGKSSVAKASLDHGPGLYGYRCTTSTANGISGFVLVSP
jgi:plastocyanin